MVFLIFSCSVEDPVSPPETVDGVSSAALDLCRFALAGVGALDLVTAPEWYFKPGISGIKDTSSFYRYPLNIENDMSAVYTSCLSLKDFSRSLNELPFIWDLSVIAGLPFYVPDTSSDSVSVSASVDYSVISSSGRSDTVFGDFDDPDSVFSGIYSYFETGPDTLLMSLVFTDSTVDFIKRMIFSNGTIKSTGTYMKNIARDGFSGSESVIFKNGYNEIYYSADGNRLCSLVLADFERGDGSDDSYFNNSESASLEMTVYSGEDTWRIRRNLSRNNYASNDFHSPSEDFIISASLFEGGIQTPCRKSSLTDADGDEIAFDSLGESGKLKIKIDGGCSGVEEEYIGVFSLENGIDSLYFLSASRDLAGGARRTLTLLKKFEGGSFLDYTIDTSNEIRDHYGSAFGIADTLWIKEEYDFAEGEFSFSPYSELGNENLGLCIYAGSFSGTLSSTGSFRWFSRVSKAAVDTSSALKNILFSYDSIYATSNPPPDVGGLPDEGFYFRYQRLNTTASDDLIRYSDEYDSVDFDLSSSDSAYVFRSKFSYVDTADGYISVNFRGALGKFSGTGEEYRDGKIFRKYGYTNPSEDSFNFYDTAFGKDQKIMSFSTGIKDSFYVSVNISGDSLLVLPVSADRKYFKKGKFSDTLNFSSDSVTFSRDYSDSGADSVFISLSGGVYKADFFRTGKSVDSLAYGNFEVFVPSAEGAGVLWEKREKGTPVSEGMTIRLRGCSYLYSGSKL